LFDRGGFVQADAAENGVIGPGDAAFIHFGHETAKERIVGVRFQLHAAAIAIQFAHDVPVFGGDGIQAPRAFRIIGEKRRSLRERPRLFPPFVAVAMRP